MSSPAASTPRKLFRHRDGRMVAGVAAGLSDHLDIDVVLIRVGFVVTVVLGGLGVLLYAVFWAVVPQRADEPGRPPSTRDRLQLAGFAGFGLVMLLLAQILGFGPGLLWPTAVAVAGAALLWRQADETGRQRWLELAGRQSRNLRSARGATAARYVGGTVLVVVGLITFLALHGELGQVRRALIPALVVVVGVALVIGPWLLRSWRELTEERTARIREQERVELAGRVHDSMLQTLTLIQRRANDPAEVRRLVRHSEREIRGWLYADAPSEETMRAAVESLCADIEDEYRVTIELVQVGENPPAADVQPILQAIREAAINAAKHSGQPTVSVYVEITASEVVAFVRDRGAGFDVDAVPADRYGVRESVVARMERHGGSATIRSAATTGTEVKLTLPLATAPAAS